MYETAGVVYKVNCNDCSASYIGQTGRQVKDRMDEHKRDVENCKRTSHIF